MHVNISKKKAGKPIEEYTNRMWNYPETKETIKALQKYIFPGCEKVCRFVALQVTFQTKFII